jgi:hypothetical protein
MRDAAEMRYGRNDLPTVIATSVVRSTHKGESHGGIYLIDLRNGDQQQVRSWDDPSISWAGRGDERGLRGIAFHGRSVLIAASDRIVVLDRALDVVDSFLNPYLKHCHEIYRAGDTLWLSSTGFDCVLGFELSTGRFSIGYHLTRSYPSRVARKLERAPSYSVRTFDPGASTEPVLEDRLHVNNVWPQEGSILVSGTGLRHIVEIRDCSTGRFARVPRGTHNAHPFRDGILANHTASNQIAFMNRSGRVRKSFPIAVYPKQELMHASLPTDHARQAFGRGLCTWKERIVIGGSSPATVSAFDFDTGELLARVNVTMDVRNAIHGLEVWPF